MLALLLSLTCVSALTASVSLLPPAPAAAAPPPSHAPAHAAALFGPPAICHPIAIGDAPSLPWKDGAFAVDPGYDRSRTVNDTLNLLDDSGNSLAHMETLRRAVIYLTGAGTRSASKQDAVRTEDIARLLQELQARAESEEQVRAAAPAHAPAPAGKAAPAARAPEGAFYLLPFAAAPPPPAPRALPPGGQGCRRAASGCDAGLCWFDVGYARAALAQLGVETGGMTVAGAVMASTAAGEAAPHASPAAAPHDGAAAPATSASKAAALSAPQALRFALERAAALRPQDGGVQLGIVLAYFDAPRARGTDAADTEWLPHLDRALALADDPQGLLQTNLLGTVGRFLGASTHAELVAAADDRRRGS